MWVRKRLDIGWRDLAYGCLQCAWPRRPPSDEAVAANWIAGDEALVCLSVRSGLDLLLTALGLPVGSEVVLSAVNVPDMGQIVERHGLAVVPVDVEPDTFHPSAESVKRALSERTKLIVIAHLFGSRADLDPIASLANRAGVLLVEDCAQAFVGRAYGGHASSDVALFSFGPIKTATALGGAVVQVKDPALRERMRTLQQQFPKQPRLRYLVRILKYAALKLLTSRPVYGGVVRALKLSGADHDHFLQGRLRSFGGPADLLTELRLQPCQPLKHLLRRRIARFDESEVAARQVRGRRLANHLARPDIESTARREDETFWVFPFQTHAKDGLAKWLLTNGYDIARRSSLVALQPSVADQPQPRVAEQAVRSLVFLPAYTEMPDREIDRLADLVRQFEAQHTARQPAAADPAA